MSEIPKTTETDTDFFSLYDPKTLYLLKKKKKKDQKKKKHKHPKLSTKLSVKSETEGTSNDIEIINNKESTTSVLNASARVKVDDDDLIVLDSDSKRKSKSENKSENKSKSPDLDQSLEQELGLTPSPDENDEPKIDLEQIRREIREKALIYETDMEVQRMKLRQQNPISASRYDHVTKKQKVSKSKSPTEEVPIYHTLIESQVPFSFGIIYNIKIKANQEFSRILKGWLKQIQHDLTCEVTKEEFLRLYNINNLCLVWQNTEILPYVTPASLKIDDGFGDVKLIIMTRDEFHRQDNQRRQDEERERELRELEDEAETYTPPARKKSIEIASSPTNKDGTTNLPRNSSNDEEHDDYFRVVMKGKDNDPIAVQVNPETVISKLENYYKQKKNIPANIKITLLFDDDKLESNQKVGDTELENDFTIDVIVGK